MIQPTLPNGHRSVNFFLLIFANFAPCASSRAVSFHFGKQLTAADVFQMLEISICVVVDSLQNDDHHSRSMRKNVPVSGAFKSSDPIPILCPCAVFGCSTTFIHDIFITEKKIAGILWYYINLKKKKKRFSYLPTLFFFFFKGHLKHRIFFSWPKRSVLINIFLVSWKGVLQPSKHCLVWVGVLQPSKHC